MNTNDSYYEEDRSMAEVDLEIAIDRTDFPERLGTDDYQNILDSFRWCLENTERRMVIQFAYHLRHFFEQSGRWNEGVFCVEKGIAACNQADAEQVCAQLFFTLGILFDRQGILDKAKEQYRLSIEAAQSLSNQALLADGLHRLGWIHHRHGEFIEAETLYIRAKNIRECVNDSLLAKSRSWHQLGILAQDRKDYNSAWEYYDKALLLREAAIHKNEPGSLYLKAASLYQQGSLAKLQHKWAEAIRFFEKSRDIRQQVDDLIGVADALDQLGSVAYLQEDWTKAFEFYEYSLKQKKDRKDFSGAISIKIRLGEVRFKQNQLENALSWFQDCLNDISCNEVLREPFLESQIRTRLGQVFLFLKPMPDATSRPNYESAIHHYEISSSLLKDINGKQWELAGALYQLGLSYFEWGYQAFEQKDRDKARERWQRSEDYYCRCLNLQMQMGPSIKTAQTHFQLGMVYQALSDYTQAEQYFQKSYTLFEEEKNIALQAEALYRLAGILKITNRIPQAIEYSQRAIHLLQSHDLPVMKGLTNLLIEVQSKLLGVKSAVEVVKEVRP